MSILKKELVDEGREELSAIGEARGKVVGGEGPRLCVSLLTNVWRTWVLPHKHAASP